VAIEVRVIGRNVDHALKILRRQLSRENVFKVLQDHAHYAKPSERRKRKIARAESRRRKAKARWKNKVAGDER
jgi:small subunit ribosomal protein S21